jgi:hypothetical protein
MLTIFTIPKPFSGHVGLIQRNAIRSWLALSPSCEIILLGDEDGTAKAASEFGVHHIPGMACTELGTPLLSDAFRRAEDAASFSRLCYVNTDIMLPATFTEAVGQVTLPAFLMVGQCMNVDVDAELDLRDREHIQLLEGEIQARGSLRPVCGSDYFVFTRGALGHLLPFAVGRPGWDNWVIFRARQLGLPVVDASPRVLVFHQNHDYRHVPKATGAAYEGPEADINRRLIDYSPILYLNPTCATWHLDKTGLVRRRWRARNRDVLARETAALHPWMRPMLLSWIAFVDRRRQRVQSRLARSAPPD